MPHLLWDASGLAKRYVPETGDATVLALWGIVAAKQRAATFTGYSETYSILLRKHRRREISASTLANAKTLLQSDTLRSLDFTLVALDTLDVLASLPLMEKYSINSSDAAILAAFLRYAPTSGDVCVLVAADGRFLKAAAAQGLTTLNPELMPAADVAAFLASL